MGRNGSLPGVLPSLSMGTMDAPQEPVSPTPGNSLFNPDVVFSALNDPVRRNLVVALALGGVQPASKLNAGVGRKVDTVVKALSVLRSAGLVEKRDNPVDASQPLYALMPTVPVRITETELIMDFGFCELRFDSR